MSAHLPGMLAEPPYTSSSRITKALVPVVCSLLPGFLAGIQLAGLLFFLNPHWPFEASALLRTTALYSVLLASGSALLVLPFTWGRPDRARRILPWALFIAFATAGVVHWVHAARFNFFLPAGINRRLIKAALWLSLAAVITFYTALLHSLQQRSYGRRSKAGFVLIALLASYVVFERRDAFKPQSEPAPRSSTIPTLEHPTLLVVGIEGLTLDVVLPLAEQGELPFLAQLRRQGSAGRLAGIAPSQRIPSWFTLATAKFPFRHGMVGDRRYSAGFVQEGLEFHLTPVGLGFRRWGIPGGELPGNTPPSDSALALWQITAGLGIDTAVLDWPGAALAASSQQVLGLNATLFAAETAAVDPEQLSESPAVLAGSPLSDRLAFAQDVEIAERAHLWLARGQRPSAVSLDSELASPGGRTPSEPVAEPVADLAAEIDSATTSGRALFVTLSGVLEISRDTFGAYSSVQFEGLLGDERERQAERLRAYYRALDDVLRDLWAEVPEPRWMVIVSPYGLRSREGAERLGSLIRPQRDFEGKTSNAPDGAFLAYGPAIEPGRFVSRMEITDLAPTILYGTGLPAARDFDGRVRTEVFRTDWLKQHPITYVPSYETGLRGPP